MLPGDGSSPPRAFWPSASPLDRPATGGPGRQFFCQVCRISCSGAQPWREHVESARHMKMVADVAERRSGALADGITSSVSWPGSMGGSPAPSVADSDSPVVSPSRRPPGMEARPFFCEACQLNCNGPAPWREHVKSARHLKRVSLESGGAGGGQPTSRPSCSLSVDEVLGSVSGPGAAAGPPASLAASDGPSASPVMAAAGHSAPAANPGGSFYCQYCRLGCSGPEPWKQHVTSAKHLKKKSQAETRPHLAAPAGCLTQAETGRSRSPAPPMGVMDDPCSGAVSSDSVPPGGAPVLPVSAGSYQYCAACQIHCSGPEPWKQHLESGRHLKQVSQASSLPGLIADRVASVEQLRRPPTMDGEGTTLAMAPPSGSAPADATGDPHYCAACQIHCSGPEPWKQHLESGRHLKQVSQISSLPRLIADCVASVEQQRRPPTMDGEGATLAMARPSGPALAGATGDPHYCAACQIHCSGPEPWKQHLESGRHIKLTSQRLPESGGGAMNEVSSSVEAMETDGPRPGLNPFNPFYCDVMPEESTTGRPSPAASPLPSQTWGWLMQLPDGSAGTPQTGLSGGGSDRIVAEVDGAAPQPHRPAAGPGGVTEVLGSAAASAGGPSTPVSAVCSGRSTPVSAVSDGRSTPVSAVSDGRSTPVSVISNGHFRCDICRLDLTGREPLQQHLRGAKHAKTAALAQRAHPG